MSDLDTTILRRALKAPGDQANPVDVTQIMTRGHRLRRRRRLAAVAGGVCAVAIMAGAGTALANLTTTAPPAPSVPVGPAQHGPQHGSQPGPQPGPGKDRPPQRGSAQATPVPTRSPVPNRTPEPTVSPNDHLVPAAATTGATAASGDATPIPTASQVSGSTPTALPARTSPRSGPTPAAAVS